MNIIVMSFVCKECGVTIKPKRNIKRHVKRFHGNRKHDVKRHTKMQSKDEAAIQKVLDKQLNSKYIYELEKSFSDLRSYGKGGLLRYDLAISPIKGKRKYFIIVYDGKQHYVPVKWFREISNIETINRLEEIQSNVNQKDEYARLHGYPILRNSYGQYKIVEKLVVKFLGEHGLL